MVICDARECNLRKLRSFRVTLFSQDFCLPAISASDDQILTLVRIATLVWLAPYFIVWPHKPIHASFLSDFGKNMCTLIVVLHFSLMCGQQSGQTETFLYGLIFVQV